MKRTTSFIYYSLPGPPTGIETGTRLYSHTHRLFLMLRFAKAPFFKAQTPGGFDQSEFRVVVDYFSTRT